MPSNPPPAPPLPRHSHPAGKQALDRHGRLIGRALAHVETHLDARLDADVLADRAAMSRHHFHRVFQAHVGCSVAAYVTWRRLQRACALLASGSEPVLEIALQVGYESAQALAKAMRRELDTTPSAVRRGDAAAWTNLLHPGRLGAAHPSPTQETTMQPTRFCTLPVPDGHTPPMVALTATARGMVGHSLSRAARQAFSELMDAVGRAGQMPAVASCIALVPDDPKGPDDPHCRYVAGVIFGHALANGEGRCVQPDIALTGSLAWWPMAPGRHVVFTHRGPYDTLHQSWDSIYRDWLPASGVTLRDAPPLELMLNDPSNTAPTDLLTELWIPVT